MAWFLFIDESGHDRKDAPYEVLAGMAVEDRDLWPIVKELHTAEVRNFGGRYSAGRRELKGRQLLKSKVFRHLGLSSDIRPEEVPRLAKLALERGAEVTAIHLKALALAKTRYCRDLLDICIRHDCRIFASMVEISAPRTATDGLRKDYAYLFERFFYFLEDRLDGAQGIIVFDELEKSRSHLLIDQAHRYFKETAIGRQRAGSIIPEPLFVHSELTTGIQLADVASYCLSWGFRTPAMTRPKRSELAPYAEQLARLRYRTTRERQGNSNFEVWSIAHISDLRTNLERDDSKE